MRITVSGAVSAGVVTSLLIAERAPFSAAPLGDGRWVVEAEVSDSVMARIEAHGSAPITVEDMATGETATMAVPKPVRVAAQPAPAATPEPQPESQFEDEVVDRHDFEAVSEQNAKHKATRLALERLGARPYPGVTWQLWKQQDDASLFVRPAYRGKKDGFMVVGIPESGHCFLGWRRRKQG